MSEKALRKSSKVDPNTLSADSVWDKKTSKKMRDPDRYGKKEESEVDIKVKDNPNSPSNWDKGQIDKFKDDYKKVILEDRYNKRLIYGDDETKEQMKARSEDDKMIDDLIGEVEVERKKPSMNSVGGSVRVKRKR
jgi:hypothetical protein